MISPTAKAAIAELDAASVSLEEQMGRVDGDRSAAQARLSRAYEAGQVELVKQARQRITPQWAR